MIVTPKGLKEKDLWDKACKVMENGLIDVEFDEEIEITKEQAKAIGLV